MPRQKPQSKDVSPSANEEVGVSLAAPNTFFEIRGSRTQLFDDAVGIVPGVNQRISSQSCDQAIVMNKGAASDIRDRKGLAELYRIHVLGGQKAHFPRRKIKLDTIVLQAVNAEHPHDGVI